MNAHELFEKVWAAEYPDHPAGSAQFEKNKSEIYIRPEVRTGYAMFVAALELAAAPATHPTLDMSLKSRLADAEADLARLHKEKMELWEQVHFAPATPPNSARQLISISQESFSLLTKWASVGRTIDAAIALIDEIDSEQADHTFEELKMLKSALDDCGHAAKSEWWKQNPQGLPHQPKPLKD
jgi:hypothetical protein